MATKRNYYLSAKHLKKYYHKVSALSLDEAKAKFLKGLKIFISEVQVKKVCKKEKRNLIPKGKKYTCNGK